MMNRILIYIFFLQFLAVANTNAQPYQSLFSVTGATKWVFIWNNLPGWVHDTARVQKDTVIHGINYKKIATGYDYLGYEGLLREDTNSGKVWYRDIAPCPSAIDTVERIVFDFSLQVGDTFEMANYYYYMHDSCKVVDSIRYINGLKYIYFKCNYLQYGEPMVMVEGVGSNMGIMTKDCDGSEFGNKYLLCSYKNGQKTSFVNRKYSGACWIYSNIKEHYQTKEDIMLYPQPVGKVIHIRCEKDKRVTCFEIMNMLGAVIRKSSSATGFTEIDVQGLTPGYYVIKMTTDSGFRIARNICIQ